MSISSVNHNSHVHRAPPPARTESTSQKQAAQPQPAQTQEKSRTQATQDAARTERQADKYEQPKDSKVKAASQPDLTGKPQYEQRNAGHQDSHDSVPELGGTQAKSGTGTGADATSGGKNSAGVEKQSAKELIDASGGKETYPQNAPENKGEGYGQEKQKMLDAATKAGASKEEAAVMTAQYMLEGGRDATKDGSGAAKNYGPLNLNGDLLQKSGMSQGDMDKMNAVGSDGKPTQEAMDLSAKAAHAAMKDMGVNGYLNHVRGGSTGYEHPDRPVNSGGQGLIQDDPDAFARTVAQSAKKVLETGADNNRYAGNIPHI